MSKKISKPLKKVGVEFRRVTLPLYVIKRNKKLKTY